MKLNEEIKVLAFDYDGTLVDYNRQMSLSTKQALLKLKENGYKLALASGRICTMCKDVISEVIDVNTFDYIFGGNGSEYLDVKTGDIKIMHYIDIPEMARIMKALDNTIGIPAIYNNDLMHIPYGVDKNKYLHLFKWSVNQIENIKFEDIYYTVPKVLYIFDEKDYEKALEVLNKADLDGYHFVRSRPTALEIMPDCVSKANVVDILINEFGYRREEIMSFGDEENDLPMLNNSVGVIMENAREELKKGFKYICEDVRKGGISSFLKENGFIE